MYLSTFIVFFALTHSSYGLYLDCEFSNSFWSSLSYTYTCNADVRKCAKDDIKCNSQESTRVTGELESSLSHEDVHGLLIALQRHLTHFPRNLHKAFPHLWAIDLEGCGLTSISRSDLAPLTDLIEISLEDNRIMELPLELFAHNPGLKWINLAANEILHIGSGIFDRLDNLTMVDLRQNPCTSESALALSRDDLEFLVLDVQVECPNNLRMLSRDLIHTESFADDFKKFFEMELKSVTDRMKTLEREVRVLSDNID